MKVKELIEELQKCDPELLVVVSDYDRARDKWGPREADLVFEGKQSDGTIAVLLG